MKMLTDRQADRRTDRRTDKTDRRTEIQTDRQDRQTDAGYKLLFSGDQCVCDGKCAEIGTEVLSVTLP